MYDIFSQTLGGLFEGDHMGIAVSGGADSMALVHLAKLYADRNKIKITAFTVDHGLRTASATEAAAVAAWCKQHNIPHHILTWQGDKPTTGLQDAARNARRKLLCEACVEHECDALLLGHQADDQAETLLMRLQRGTGLRGLLGIRDESHDDATDTIILRPLLTMRRADLRDYCVKNDLPFHDDPSNDDTQFERVRIRKALEALPELANGIAQTVARLSDIDETLDLLATEWLEENIEPIDEQTIWLPQEFLEDLYPPLQLRVLEGALLEVLPEDASLHDIPLDGLERLRDAMEDKKFGGQTLADAQIKPHKADGVTGFLFTRAPKRR